MRHTLVNIAHRMFGRIGLYALVRLARNGYLAQTGWMRAFYEQSPVNRAGLPIPWFTYPALTFLEARTRPSFSVFEWGSGSSTLWWASRVNRIISCEHDLIWYHRLKSRLPHNVELRLVPPDGTSQYAAEIHNTQGYFDVVVIDGIERIDCARTALDRLHSSGVIVFDDTDRTQYTGAFDALAAKGFRRIDFPGMKAMSLSCSCTSIFYRSGNCLCI